MLEARRLGVRRRLRDYAEYVLRTGAFNRTDLMRIGEVSIAQASADVKMLIEDFPELAIVYDASAKAYRGARLLKVGPCADEGKAND